MKFPRNAFTSPDVGVGDCDSEATVANGTTLPVKFTVRVSVGKNAMELRGVSNPAIMQPPVAAVVPANEHVSVEPSLNASSPEASCTSVSGRSL